MTKLLPFETRIFAAMGKIHIGERIRAFVRTKKLTDSQFGNLIGLSRAGVQKLYPKDFLDTELLQKISQALDHDFFADISKGLGMVKEKDPRIGFATRDDISQIAQLLEKMSLRLDLLESKLQPAIKKAKKKKNK
jgi:transcriptional regulator with XRE-family HTH domain